jgi:negative regulator of sigma E activity
MKDQISALVDGELDGAEASRLVGRLRDQTDLRRCWNEYQLVGDALRGHVCCDLTTKVASRLATEPTVLAPHRHDRLKAVVWPALSAAAGAAAVAVVAWVVFPASAPLETPALASASAPAGAMKPSVGATLVASPQGSAQAAAGVPVVATINNALPRESSLVDVGDYLLAHQRFSPANAMQGVAPYARTVSAETRPGEGESR